MAKPFSNNRFLELAYGVFRELRNAEVNLTYVGDVSPVLTRNFTITTEESLLRQNENSPVQRKVFNVMVEALQNISRHADTISGDSDEPRQGLVLVAHSDDEYNIVTGNLIRKSKVEALSRRLDEINVMDKAQLSAAYKEQITNGHINESGGAGLGFIDIAKKSGNKIKYRFVDIDDPDFADFSVFLYICTIVRK